THRCAEEDLVRRDEDPDRQDRRTASGARPGDADQFLPPARSGTGSQEHRLAADTRGVVSRAGSIRAAEAGEVVPHQATGPAERGDGARAPLPAGCPTLVSSLSAVRRKQGEPRRRAFAHFYRPPSRPVSVLLFAFNTRFSAKGRAGGFACQG